MARQPSSEERRLWREATRHDTKFKAEPPLADEAVAPVISKTVKPPQAVPPKTPASPKPPLAMLSAKQAARSFKSKPVDAVLDLHGFSKLDAYGRVQAFIAQQSARGARHVLVITGKGRIGEGVLRANLPHWLNEPALRGMVSGFSHARPEKGGSGVLHVLLKARKPS